MNDIELNAILYYADFLSLKHISLSVTDNCKYFYIHGAPINSLYILDMLPVYDESNEYFKLAKTEYLLIKDKFGDDGVLSFIEDICSIRACGSVDAERMLRYIHQYSNKKQRRQAFTTYYNWKKSLKYFHTVTNEDGEPEKRQCSSYTYHVERMLGRSQMDKSL